MREIVREIELISVSRHGVPAAWVPGQASPDAIREHLGQASFLSGFLSSRVVGP